MAEPSPALATGTDPMSVVVKGATTRVMPMPNSTTAGSTSVNTSEGGHGDPDARPSSHGALSEEMREIHARPDAISTGPTTRKRHAPIRPATVPTRVENSVSRMPVGRLTAAAARAV